MNLIERLRIPRSNAQVEPVVDIGPQPISLDQLWQQAERLGAVRVYTATDFTDKKIRDYHVKIVGHRGNAKIEVEHRHYDLLRAFELAIAEARSFGMCLEG
jgi:predicted urease superfamily metal-dependent hydrolase